jgi:hypothetical protein
MLSLVLGLLLRILIYRALLWRECVILINVRTKLGLSEGRHHLVEVGKRRRSWGAKKFGGLNCSDGLLSLSQQNR